MTERLLVAYSSLSNFVSTTAEYVNSFGRFSGFDVRYLNVTPGVKIGCDLDNFDAIFHSYCARFPINGLISDDYLARLKTFRGLKILAVQDEYDRTNALHQAIRHFNFDIVLTCVPEHLIEQIYPRDMFPQTEFFTILTGYVPEALAELPRARLRITERPIVIGYRGRDIGSRYGRLGFEKFEIGRRMREICIERGILHDIETDETKRIYGDSWYDFVESCRTMLGSESGSNIFDFDGSIQARYDELARQSGKPPSYEEFRIYTDALDSKIDIGQISPRVFEAAALRTPLILFSGRYSGILRPGEHYIELKKDFSNIDDVLSHASDIGGLENLADRAYDHLIKSERFGYRQFVRRIDELILGRLEKMGSPAVTKRALSVINANSNSAELPTRAPKHSLHAQYATLSYRYEEIASQYAALWKRLDNPLFLLKLMIAALLPRPLFGFIRQTFRGSSEKRAENSDIPHRRAF